MSLAKLKTAIEQAESLTARIDQLQRVRSLITAEHDAGIYPTHLHAEVATLPAGIAKQVLADEVARLTLRLNEVQAKIALAGQSL